MEDAMTLMGVPVLRRHVFDLARAFDVRVIEVPGLPPDRAGANPEKRAIVIGTIVDETTYAVALHELGHVLSPTGAVFDPAQDLELLREESAWAWARHHALDWSPAMDHVAQWAFGTYERKRAATRAPLPTTKHIDWSQW
jgi:hypothetical protein